ncbi:acyl-CoA N-acyltransferase [Rhizodiscina lignyota]|uniref:Acyl-CoA N-acyltransferase n=1 Tax=Rhizodiscina lignyota TaxID=1504668 RepID=A0A9P4IC30_9PEZI|nr:acyl-CoA N-acyltransferase [Rhizodiscina lignyota]
MATEGYTFETPRLGIELANPKNDIHCQLYVELNQQPTFIKNLDGLTSTTNIDTIRAFLQRRWTDIYEKWGYGNYIVWLKPLADPSLPEPKPIGTVTMVREPNAPAPDIGYAFLDAYQGKGYATESCQALLDYCRNEFNQQQYLCFTRSWNQASRALAERLGFKLEAEHRLPTGAELACYSLGTEGMNWDLGSIVEDRIKKMPLDKRAGDAAATAAPVPEDAGITETAIATS